MSDADEPVPKELGGFRLALAPPIVFWSVMVAGAVALHAIVNDFTRFFAWDEAVFFSQSGGFGRADGPALSQAATREPGTPWLIAAIRAAGASYVGVRFAWVLIFASSVGSAFGILERRVGRVAAAAGFGVVVTSWLAIQQSSTLFGVAIAVGAALVAIAVAIRSASAGGGGGIGSAVAIAGATAVAMLMRPFEGALSAVIVGGVLLGATIQRRVPLWYLPMVAGGAAIVWAPAMWFGVVSRYGSAAEWLDSISEFAGNGASFTVADLPQRLLGLEQFIATPSVAGPWLTIAGLAGLLGTSLAGWRSMEPRVLTVALGGLVLFGTWLALYRFGTPGDKYFLWLVPFLGLGAAGLLRHDRPPASDYSRRVAGAVVGSLVLLVAGGAFNASVWVERVTTDAAAGQIPLTINTLAENGECVGLARYNTPALQVGSGCSFTYAGSREALVEWIDRTSPAAVPRFVYWPQSPEELEVAGWSSVSFGNGHLWLED